MAPTYLRVKRPRHVTSLPYLRVEGLSEAGSKRLRSDTLDNLACLLHQSTYIAAQQQQKSTVSAVWKRVDVDCKDAGSSNQKRLFVDAVLDDIDGDEGPRTKRRRLALTLVRDAPPAAVAPFSQTVSKKNVILDPLSRLVQESLQSVLSGERTVSQHLELLSSDSRLSDETRRWLQFTGPAGNILHVSALCNDVEGALAVVAWEIPLLLQQVDADGQTPHQLAVAIGHLQVAEVLKVHRADDGEDDYVYDVFLLDKDMSVHDKEDTMTCAELRGGIGYWDEHGELILEAIQDEGVHDSDNDDNDDSNCEDYHGNDYPEEEDDECWEEGDSVEVDGTFRHRPVYMFGQDVQVNTKPADESDDEYDAEYGLYEPSGPHRQYAYDPDYESD